MDNILKNALDFIYSKLPSATYSKQFREPAQAQTFYTGDSPAPQATSQPTASPVASALQQAQPQATPIAISPDQLKQNISNTWGANTPMLNNINDFVQGGNQLPGNMEKLLPIALALRETQGGKDNMKPNSTSGQNNYFNIGNGHGWQDYPDVRTSVLGNLDQGGQSGGVTGLLSGNDPKSAYIYKDFRNSNDYHDLFNHWSPTYDSSGKKVNGPMDGDGGQIANIQWILNHIKGLQ